MNTGKRKKSKRGPGRPKKAKGEGKEIPRAIRFRKEELELFEKAAKKNSQNFSEWVRETLRRTVTKHEK